MQFTAELIASMVGGTVDGDAAVAVNTFAKIEEAQAGSITFLANPKYTRHIYTTGASVVLVSRDFTPEKPISATLIRVDDPYETLSRLLETAQKLSAETPEGIEQPSYIADSATLGTSCYVGAFAYIGKGAKLGNNVKIYPQAYVGADVTIGDDTTIYPGAKIYHGCKIGCRCTIHAGAVIGADGFGFAPTADGSYHKIPQLGIVELADDVEIGANTTVDRATMGETVIGKGTKLDNLIQIGHNVKIGSNTVMAAQSGIAGSTRLGSNCMIGGQVGLSGHIKVGDNVQIGAQSGVPGDVADGSRIMGSPAVHYSDFARQAVYIKQLASLFGRVKDIEKSMR